MADLANERAAQAQQALRALEAQAVGAAQSGREAEAVALWNRILEIDPRHARTLLALGQRAFRKGAAADARALFQRLVEVDGSDPQQWANLALACRALQDEAGEEEAIRRALMADPMDLLALILRANLLERQGRRHKAAQAYGAVAAVAPPLEKLHPDLRAAVAHAWRFREEYNREFAAYLDSRLEARYRSFDAEDLARFRESVDILVGRKKRYDSLSGLYHYPRLAPIEFFDRAELPWIEAVEAATDEIRQEFLEILETDRGFTPYISYPPDVPHNQWAELNNSERWSAFHLLRMGERIEENASRCPRTMKALEAVPQPQQPGRTPTAMFSLLKPRTRIPAHNGVTNSRLVAHLALIVPPDCGFRVGNEVRHWKEGAAWVFDDTIEHEAWNESDKLRVVLIFDVWHPHLSAAERELITAMSVGLREFMGDLGGYEI